MIEEICQCIYEKADGIGLGHFVWCPVTHLDEVPRILEVERAASEAHYATRFHISQMNGNHFKAKQKLPVKALSLGDTEELIISKAKKRPCLVLACNNTSFKDPMILSEIKNKRHLQDESMILAPIFGSATPDDEKGFPPIMVARIRVFLYKQFFYLPESCPKTKTKIGKESVARLDRLFAASPNRGVTPMGIKLSDEPLLLLMALLRERFGTTPDENLKTVREILDSSLPDHCRPNA